MHSKDRSFPNNSWFNDECKIMKRNVNRYAKEHDISRSPYAEEYIKLEKEYNRIKQYHKRKYQDDTRNKLNNLNSNNPSDYWKLWKSLNHKQSNNSKLTLTDFEEYFKNQITPPHIEYFDQNHMKEVDDFIKNYSTGNIKVPYMADNMNASLSNEICNGVITIEEVQCHVQKLKNNKAAGSDKLVAEFLKYAPNDIHDMLFAIFNFIFDKGEWPAKWAEGLINPVHKKGSINTADNYRKITVMPVIGKVLESILNSRLVHKNITLQLDDPCQFGFKSNSRTTDNIFILYSMIMRQKFKNKPLYVCFVDFTKAFDYVNRNALYHKLISRGVNGKLLNLLCDMYKKAKCRVKWNGRVGEELDSEFGVLQGGMLSPKLFTEFLYDIKQFLDNEYGVLLGEEIMMYILYADDLVLTSDSAEGLQKLINGLYKFCSKWHLIVSLTKTSVLIFGKSTGKEKFTFGENVIEINTEYNYLGTVFSSNTRDIFKLNYTHLANKAQNAIFALQGFAKHTIGKLQPNLAIKMFDAQISPILEYASEIWYHNKEISDHEKLHLAFLKNTIKVKPSTSTLAIYTEFGRFPVALKQQYRMITYWERILNLDNSHLVKQAYNSLYELSELGQENWCTHVKNALIKNHLEPAWEEQYLNSKMISTLKENLHKQFMEHSLRQINDSTTNPKLRTYKLFKTQYKLEPHLMSPTNLNHTYALARFRISSHNLRIETGRYTKPKTPANERLCLYCPSQSVEDESHFLLNCNLYSQERSELLDTIKLFVHNFDDLSELEQFSAIMCSSEPLVIKNLGKFVYNGLKKRSTQTI